MLTVTPRGRTQSFLVQLLQYMSKTLKESYINQIRTCTQLGDVATVVLPKRAVRDIAETC